jgi:hypothetical protein
VTECKVQLTDVDLEVKKRRRGEGGVLCYAIMGVKKNDSPLVTVSIWDEGAYVTVTYCIKLEPHV